MNQAAIKELKEKIAAIDESNEEMPLWSNIESKPSMLANESNDHVEAVEIENEKKLVSNKKIPTSKATEKIGTIFPNKEIYTKNLQAADLSSKSYKKVSDLRHKIKVESSFSPSTISIKDSTTYRIVLNGTQKKPLGKLPQVPGLKISNSPQTLRSERFVNNVRSVSLELNFQVQTERVGKFTIPSWNLMIEGKEIQVPPATLQVLASSQAKQVLSQQRMQLRDGAFLDLNLPFSELKKGKKTEGKITLYIWDRLPVYRIENTPTLIGDGFTIQKLGKCDETLRNVSLNGKFYSTFSWNLEVTPVQTGRQSIGFEVNIRLRVNSKKNSSSLNSSFNDPFLGFGQEETLTVKLPQRIFTVTK